MTSLKSYQDLEGKIYGPLKYTGAGLIIEWPIMILKLFMQARELNHFERGLKYKICNN